VAAGVDDQEHREHDEDADLEGPEQRAHPGRGPDAVEAGG
jgi:hypothetical protein